MPPHSHRDDLFFLCPCSSYRGTPGSSHHEGSARKRQRVSTTPPQQQQGGHSSSRVDMAPCERGGGSRVDVIVKGSPIPLKTKKGGTVWEGVRDEIGQSVGDHSLPASLPSSPRRQRGSKDFGNYWWLCEPDAQLDRQKRGESVNKMKCVSNVTHISPWLWVGPCDTTTMMSRCEFTTVRVPPHAILCHDCR